ncbi:MAG: hypothetical protein KDK78_01335, partial [Chlamydiia bacterium]|nr:hypothetical protein [Chlamydiia bacterium]
FFGRIGREERAAADVEIELEHLPALPGTADEGVLISGLKSFAVTVLTSNWAHRLALLCHKIGIVVYNTCMQLEQFFLMLQRLIDTTAHIARVQKQASSPIIDVAERTLLPTYPRPCYDCDDGEERIRIIEDRLDAASPIRNRHVVLSPPNANRIPASGDPGLDELRARGYQVLAERLLKEEGMPWDRIRLLSSADLMEQIVDLHDCMAAQTNAIPDATRNHILSLALSQAEKHIPANQAYPGSRFPNLSFSPRIAMKTLMRRLGELLHLVNHQPAKLSAVGDDKSAMSYVQRTFEKEMKLLRERMDGYKEAHIRTGMQDPERAVATRLPMELARFLLNPTGTINYGIIPQLMDSFLSDSPHRVNHEMNLHYTLALLHRSPRLREKFNSLHRPESPFCPSNPVIRTMLRYPAEKELTDFDAKLAALGGLLSHLRQGNVGSCFATFLAIQLQAAHLDRCLEDFQQMLSKGAITRQVGEASVEFPFLLRMSTDCIDTPIDLNSDGRVRVYQRKEGYIWESPGLQAACHAIGISDHEAALRVATKTLHAAQKETPVWFKCKGKDLIDELCKMRLQDESNSLSLRQLCQRACFAFEAETSCALLRVWENAIAGMAEADLNGQVRKASVTATGRSILCELRDGTKASTGARNQFFNLWIDLLSAKSRMQYDPDVPHKDTATDGHSTEGAYVLYDTMDATDIGEWKRIDTPELYQDYVLRILEEAWAKVEFGDMKDALKKELSEALPHMRDYIASETFLTDALYHYDVSNLFGKDPLKDPEALEHTPWVDKCGNNTPYTLQIYLEMANSPMRERIQAENAQDLLKRVVHLAKSASDETRELFEANPYKLVSVRTPGQHAFTLMLGHPDMVKAWRGDKDLDQWIQAHVIEPGLAVAEAKLPDASRQEMISYCHRYHIGKGRADRFNQLANQIPSHISVQRFRDQLIDCVLQVEGSNIKDKQLTMRRIDSRLVSVLPEGLRQVLSESALHFADTNWNSGVQDLHFCFVVNPGTKAVEIWKSYADRSIMMAMNQNDWLLEREWEFFTDLELIPHTDLIGRSNLV